MNLLVVVVVVLLDSCSSVCLLGARFCWEQTTTVDRMYQFSPNVHHAFISQHILWIPSFVFKFQQISTGHGLQFVFATPQTIPNAFRVFGSHGNGNDAHVFLKSNPSTTAR
jgi:hypothetical protein